MGEISNAQRAFWMFIVSTLAAPFFAALTVFLLSAAAGLMGVGPDSLKAAVGPAKLAWAADKALGAFVWSAIPAAAAAIFLAGWVLREGRFPWLAAAVAGAVAATIGAYLTGGVILQHVSAVAFIAAGVGALMQVLMTRSGILVR